MIFTTLHGRLGNNMFQVATGIALSKQIGSDLLISEMSHAGHRGDIINRLDIFSYPFNIVNDADVTVENTYNEPHFHYTPIDIQDNCKISGFFQSWKYFDNIRNELIDVYFKPNLDIVTSLSKYQVSKYSLGISVRRGDYLMLQNNHCVLSIDYYQAVINRYFQEGIDSIYIFSDDLEWCMKVFGSGPIYVDDDIGTQLFLMTKMKHLILSNSTFAWWGAYLNTNDGVIIAPDPWFGENYSNKNTSDLYYPSWKKEKHIITLQDFTITSNMYDT